MKNTAERLYFSLLDSTKMAPDHCALCRFLGNEQEYIDTLSEWWYNDCSDTMSE